MADYAAIADASESLLKLLQDALRGLVMPDDVTLASPSEIALDTSPRLAVFLYQVTPNTHLRNLEPQRIDSRTQQPAPAYVDLSFLLVPYAQKREDEHKILGRVIQALSAIPALRGSWLQGGLAGSDSIRVLLHPLPLEEQLRLWNSFGHRPYKLCTASLLTPVRIDSSAEPFVVPAVVERQLQVHSA